MADTKEKDKVPNKLTKEVLQKQIDQTNVFVQGAQQQVIAIQNEIQQQLGIAAYARHLLSQYDIAEEPKTKPPLEVK